MRKNIKINEGRHSSDSEGQKGKGTVQWMCGEEGADGGGGSGEKKHP